MNHLSKLRRATTVIIGHLRKAYGTCECTDTTTYPHIHIIACNNCGSVEYVGGTLRYLQ